MEVIDYQKPWAVLPLKSVKTANSRLSPVLSAVEREELSLLMVKDVVSVLESSDNLGGLLVITNCPIVAAHYAKREVTVLSEGNHPHLNSAIKKAVQFLHQLGVEKFFTVPGDVPLLNLSELDCLIQRVQMSNGIALVPSHDGQGTNSIASSIPIRISPQFGFGSFSIHRQSAKDQDVSVDVFSLPGLGFDIDEPQDLIRLSSIDGNSRTQKFLTKLDLVDRSNGFAKVSNWRLPRPETLM